MGYDIVIEGIEDEAMFKFFSTIFASHFQGYFINRPNPVPNTSLDFVSKTL